MSCASPNAGKLTSNATRILIIDELYQGISDYAEDSFPLQPRSWREEQHKSQAGEESQGPLANARAAQNCVHVLAATYRAATVEGAVWWAFFPQPAKKLSLRGIPAGMHSAVMESNHAADRDPER
jgi:hypothetical protein